MFRDLLVLTYSAADLCDGHGLSDFAEKRRAEAVSYPEILSEYANLEGAVEDAEELMVVAVSMKIEDHH